MSSNSIYFLSVVAGIAAVTVSYHVILWFVSKLLIQVEDEHEVLVTEFGKLTKKISEPGAHFHANKLWPWVKIYSVSKQLDFKHFKDIHVNDCRGTTLIVDLWVEYKISDPEKALFQVEHFEEALESLLTHAVTSVLGTQEFKKILMGRLELGELLLHDIEEETARWGLNVEKVMIFKVNLLPVISRQLFDSVAARLERAKAKVEEEGRLRIEQLEATTDVNISKLLAEAQGQYPLAIHQAYSIMKKKPSVFKAYKTLYELSQLKPHRNIVFQGFEGLRSIDAAMLSPSDKLQDRQDPTN